MSGRRGLVVVKVGGGLTQVEGALETVTEGLLEAGRRHRILVVPGGGPFADAVRAFGASHGLSADAAHWMSILAMDQYAHALVERIDGASLVEEPGAVSGAVGAAGVAVLAPSRWMRAADVLPHTWEATSDSVAAFVAGALDATRLVLVKPAHGRPDTMVDTCFETVLPTGLPWTVIGWMRAGELSALLAADPA